MRMNTILAGVMLCLLLACDAQAMLGETRKQIAERYGEAIPDLRQLLDYSGKGHWGVFFRSKDYVISVTFERDQSIREAYSRSDGSPIGEAEMKTLRGLNASGNEWDRLEDKDLPFTTSPIWLRVDDRARAFYNKIRKVFVIGRFVLEQPHNRLGAASRGF